MQVNFGHKQQVLHYFLLLCIILLVRISISKMFYDGPIVSFWTFFGVVRLDQEPHWHFSTCANQLDAQQKYTFS
jgi:hypothetical protein